MRKVGFEALVQEVKIKSLRTGDKSMRITLEIDSPSDRLINGINALHKADKLIGVAFAEKEKE
jgi:hypothetical protein